jgi:hypothetical protein
MFLEFSEFSCGTPSLAIKVAADQFGRTFLKGLGFARTIFPEPG